jgi:hypothetical protein
MGIDSPTIARSFFPWPVERPSSGVQVRKDQPMQPGKVILFSASADPRTPSGGQPPVVVQIGRDEELLRLRALNISAAGYCVHSMTPNQVAAELEHADAFRVWVFCNTLESYELAMLALGIRYARPGDKLLRLSSPNDTALVTGFFDELLNPMKSVEDLLRTVADLACVE